MISGLLLCTASSVVWCQEQAHETVDLQQITDGMLSPEGDDLDYEALFENTIQLLTSPLDLNTVTASELASLHLLGDHQIDNILAWRTSHGPLLDVHELQVVPGMDRDAILRLLPFVRVVDPSTRVGRQLVRRMFTSGSTYVVSRYEHRMNQSAPSSPDSNAFRGSPGRIYFRMRSSLPGDFSIGLTCENDPGEPLTFDREKGQWGFDFTSFHLQLKNKGSLRNLVIGDFQTQFGQGLLFGGAFGLGKGSQITTARKAGVGFRPYTSVQESVYQRGVAVTVDVRPWLTLSAFYSRARRDAAQSGDSLHTYALQHTGLHRDTRERASKNAVTEEHTGAILQCNINGLEAGITTRLIAFSDPVEPSQRIYNRFSFRGSVNLDAGLFLNYRVGSLSFFSEVAKSRGAGTGLVTGVLISPHKRIDLAVLYRSYGRSFRAFYTNAFSENTLPQNEEGMYWAWKYTPVRRVTVNGYIDIFHFPWLGFRRYKPSWGSEWLLRTTYQPARDISLFLQLRDESKLLNESGEAPLYKVSERGRRNLILHIAYPAGKRITLRSRIQYNTQRFQQTVTRGWAFVHDISIRAGRFEGSARHALFDTDHFDNRHYVYERDAWSAYSMPAYAGTGVRNYVLIEYKTGKNLTLWLRYAVTRMLLNGEIGSGRETDAGNPAKDIKFQARLTL